MRISIINIGYLLISLKEMDGIAEGVWPSKYSSFFDAPLLFPSQSVLISSKDYPLVLVDAGDYSLFALADPSYVPPGYVPPPGLLSQLSDVGVSPEQVKHVIITHAHYDHYAGVTMKKSGDYVSTFPNALFYLGKADWDDPSTQESLKNPTSNDSNTLGVIHRSRKLQLVSGSLDITPEIRIIPSPGESPGHQLVRCQSTDGKVLYCLGDLFHHSVEVENSLWMATWDDIQSNLKSRNDLIASALGEDALVLGSHMPLGKLERNGSQVKFVEV
ncbi:MAG: MBL fold metallo-hydrolase [Nitrososphaerales archaeon]